MKEPLGFPVAKSEASGIIEEFKNIMNDRANILYP